MSQRSRMPSTDQATVRTQFVRSRPRYATGLDEADHVHARALREQNQQVCRFMIVSSRSARGLCPGERRLAATVLGIRRSTSELLIDAPQSG